MFADFFLLLLNIKDKMAVYLKRVICTETSIWEKDNYILVLEAIKEEDIRVIKLCTGLNCIWVQGDKRRVILITTYSTARHTIRLDYLISGAEDLDESTLEGDGIRHKSYFNESKKVLWKLWLQN